MCKGTQNNDAQTVSLKNLVAAKPPTAKYPYGKKFIRQRVQLRKKNSYSEVSSRQSDVTAKNSYGENYYSKMSLDETSYGENSEYAVHIYIVHTTPHMCSELLATYIHIYTYL